MSVIWIIVRRIKSLKFQEGPSTLMSNLSDKKMALFKSSKASVLIFEITEIFFVRTHFWDLNLSLASFKCLCAFCAAHWKYTSWSAGEIVQRFSHIFCLMPWHETMLFFHFLYPKANMVKIEKKLYLKFFFSSIESVYLFLDYLSFSSALSCLAFLFPSKIID